MKMVSYFFAGVCFFMLTFGSVFAYELETPTDLTVPKERVVRMTKIIESNEIKPLFGVDFIRPVIRNAVKSGVSPNTVVLLFLFPLVAGLVAFSRQVVGLSGFGLLTPAILAMAFLSTGGVVGLSMLSFIVSASMLIKLWLKKIKLPYLPKLAVLIWFLSLSVMGLMLAGTSWGATGLMSVGIFPIVLFVVLAETFIEAQITKTLAASFGMLVETVILALVAYKILSSHAIQAMVLVNPEISALVILLLDLIVGRYKGLRLLEMWRFRKLIIK